MEPVTATTTISDLYLYFLSPATIISVVGGAIYAGKKFGKFELEFSIIKNDISSIKKDMGSVKKNINGLNNCVIEIQSFLRSKYKNISLVQETLDVYGKSNSPMKLKKEFLPIVVESGLEKEVAQNKNKIIKWLTSQKPQTGLDAQDLIVNLVTGDQIEQFIDVTEFKKYLYTKGKTAKDYYTLLAVYLFEVIIPEVIAD